MQAKEKDFENTVYRAKKMCLGFCIIVGRMGQIIYIFGAFMEHSFEGLTLFKQWYINPNKSQKQKS